MQEMLLSRSSIRQWWSVFIPGGDLQRRISFFALAIMLQGIIELPHEIFGAVFGAWTGLVIMVMLGASLIFLMWAVLTPSHNTFPTNSRLTRIVLVLSIGAALVIGAHQMGTMLGASFTTPSYPNDGTTLDHYGAWLLLHGQNPYTASNVVDATYFLHQAGEFTTPLRNGPFANTAFLDYPSRSTMNSLIAADQQVHGNTGAGFESKLSYPSLSFLLLVPFVGLGLPSVVLFTVLSYLAFALVALRCVDSSERPWLALLLIADIPVLEGVAIGELDITVMLFVLLFWLLWKRPWLSTLFLGLAISTKQQAWFFALFFLIFLVQRIGWQKTILRFTGAAIFFFAVNAPFIVADPAAWLTGIAAPINDPMFPLGSGLIELARLQLLPLWPQKIYTVLELASMGISLAWYAIVGAKRYPETAFLLAMLPLWFAWRSLPTYFFFSALPMLIFWMVRQREKRAMVSLEFEKTTDYLVEAQPVCS